jgi:hypothetical protein
MGIPASLPTERRATKVTQFFTVPEIRALSDRYRTLLAPNHVVFPENFAAYCAWSALAKPVTAAALFRAFDCQRRGFFDFEDFAMTVGAVSRGTSDQLAEVVFRVLASRPLSATEASAAVAAAEGDDDSAGGGGGGSPYRTTPNEVYVRYDDVVECVLALEPTFLCMRCDGGVSAHTVASRLPFDEHGVCSFEQIKALIARQM